MPASLESYFLEKISHFDREHRGAAHALHDARQKDARIQGLRIACALEKPSPVVAGSATRDHGDSREHTFSP
jgi:hypothetical protein